MPATATAITPGLPSFLKSLKGSSANASIDHLISLLKRRQIQNARPCAIAATHLFLQVVAESKFKSVSQLTERIRNVGKRLCNAQPRELVVGNIVRRVLGLVREITDLEEDMSATCTDKSPKIASIQSSIVPDSLFNIMSNPSLIASDEFPGLSPKEGYLTETTKADRTGLPLSMRDVKDDVLNGIREMLDELDQADERIAGYALDHIHPNETILTTTASTTIQKFLLSAAKRRKFSVIYVESYPNEHRNTTDMAVSGRKKDGTDVPENDNRFKPLISAGIKVIIIPDSSIWAVMSKVDQVFLAAHSVFSSGAFMAAAGAKIVAKAAKMHQTPVTVLSGVYKFSPIFALDSEDFTEYGDPGKILDYQSGGMIKAVDIVNPLHDYVSPDLVDLYITNLGGFTPSYVYRMVADHYHEDDIDL